MITRLARPIRVSGTNIVLTEEYVGSATHGICYPSVSSCITITGQAAGGLVGAHISCLTHPDVTKRALAAMKTAGGASCLNFYVVGAITKFKAGTRDESLKTRKKIRDQIRESINPNATVWFYDTTPRDAHIFAERVGARVGFYLVSTPAILVTLTYPKLDKREAIPSTHFVVR